LSEVSFDVHDVVALRVGHQDLQKQLEAGGLVALQSETEGSPALPLGLYHWKSVGTQWIVGEIENLLCFTYINSFLELLYYLFEIQLKERLV
jgi:hypothetical protein